MRRGRGVPGLVRSREDDEVRLVAAEGARRGSVRLEEEGGGGRWSGVWSLRGDAGGDPARLLLLALEPTRAALWGVVIFDARSSICLAC